MKHDERDRMRDELLAYLYGAHEEPDRIERALARDPALRALLEDVKATARVIDAAARDAAVPFEPRVPEDSRAPRARSSPWRVSRGVTVAAALLGLLVAGLWGRVYVQAWRLERSRAADIRLVVSAPRAVPDGAGARMRAEAWTRDGEPSPGAIAWRALGADGAVLEQGVAQCDGAVDIELPARLAGVRTVAVEARRGDVTRRAELTLDPARETPLVHLATDKPLYRPGEIVRCRAVVLERLSLAPLANTWRRLRIVDPRGAAVHEWSPGLQSGTVGGGWAIPDDAPGGEYALVLLDREGDVELERLSFLVRAFRPPQLATEITLGKKTYAPGESGVAEVAVERVQGGIPAGAAIEGSLVLDGDVVWSESAALDAEGRALFRFQVPGAVERGEARFLARVTDGGVVETEIEPFVVPTGRVDVAFHPEGGELVAGLATRVYFSARDPLGRPVDVRGRVVDATGAVVSTLASEHQGRGRFALTPRAGGRYRLELEEPKADAVALPEVRDEGVVLSARAESSPAGELLALRVATQRAGPWIAAVFCRGVLVAQDPFEGAGEHELAIALPPEAAGVLRVTVFDAKLRPRAERLLHRASERSIRVAIAPAASELAPGDHQTLAIETRDETGAPVAAVLGLAVTDRALDALADEPRVGILEHALFFADAGELEDLGDFLPEHADAARNMDLALGTQGWRRFAWREARAGVAQVGTPPSRVQVMEGRIDELQVEDVSGESPRAIAALRGSTRRARGLATLVSIVVGAYAGLALLLARWSESRLVRGRPLLAAAGVLAIAAPLAWLVVRNHAVSDRAARDAGVPVQLRERRAVGDVPVPGGEWIGLAYLGGVEAEVVERERDVAMLGARGYLDFDEGAAAGEPAFFLGEPVVADRIAVARELVRVDGDDDKRKFREAGLDDADLDVYERVYAHVHLSNDGVRSDFAETVYWNALLTTDASGRAEVEFDVSDRITTWIARADAHGGGRVGGGEARFEAVRPFHAEPVLPIELTVGDRIDVPVALIASRPEIERARVLAETSDAALALERREPRWIALERGRGRELVALEARAAAERVELEITAESHGFHDVARHALRVAPRGFPHRTSLSGVVREGRARTVIAVPATHAAGSLALTVALYPSPLADLVQGLDAMLQEPHGCFEQASSANYPNVLALAYLRAAGEESPAIAARAAELLERGYAKLVGYECDERGYEWFGASPAHEALTAYGLLEFHDMAGVFDVDEAMIERTRAWLLARRDGAGGYRRNERALDSFGAAPADVTDAWITYALALGGTPPGEIDAELDALETRGLASGDSYVVALAAAALANAGRAQSADALRDALKRMQAEDGSLQGDASITRSGADDRTVETTSLAILAWLDDPDDLAPVERAVAWLREHRRHGGAFGATQATIQALRALTAHAERARRLPSAGVLKVSIQGRVAREVAFEAGHRGALVLDGLAEFLAPGPNEIVLELSGTDALPWSLDLAYASDQPADDPFSAIEVRTRLGAERVEEGRTVPLHVRVENVTDEGRPMALAIVGVPAGLACTSGVLDDLKAAGRFDFWELSGREIVLYWRGLAPRETREVSIDLLARLPGRTTGPASRAYLYYTPDAKRWAAPLTIEVDAAR